MDTRARWFTNNRLAEAWTVDGNPVRGIFAEPYAEDLEIEGQRPTLQIADEDAAGIRQDDLAVRASSGVTYAIHSIQPDGTGTTVLVLRLTS